MSTKRRSWLRKHNPFESTGIRESIDNPQFVDGLVRSHDLHVSEHNPVAETGNSFLCVYRKEYRLEVCEDTNKWRKNASRSGWYGSAARSRRRRCRKAHGLR